MLKLDFSGKSRKWGMRGCVCVGCGIGWRRWMGMGVFGSKGIMRLGSFICGEMYLLKIFCVLWYVFKLLLF